MVNGGIDFSGKTIKLASDIDLANKEWTPIGYYQEDYNKNGFNGTFDGGIHTIKGLYINTSDYNSKGLFGYTLSESIIKNICVCGKFKDDYILTPASGGIVGKNEGKVQNCIFEGTVGASGYAGGIAGQNFGSVINCYADVKITRGEEGSGAIAGYNNSSDKIKNCYYTEKETIKKGVGLEHEEEIGKYSETIGKSIEELKTGEVAWLLQNAQTAENGDVPMVWGQSIGTDNTPILTSDSSKRVYKVTVGNDIKYVNSGAMITKPAEPTAPEGKTEADGYKFAGWYNGESAETAYNFSSGVTGDVTLIEKFLPIEYTITYNLDGGSNTASNPTSYTVESNDITLANPTKAGYTFTGWSGTELTGEDNKAVTIPSGSKGDRTYTAHWQKNSSSHSSSVQKPTISLGSADVTTETAADGSTVYTTVEGKLVLSKDGTSASVTPADGYEVANVSVNGTDKGAVTTLTGLKTGDKIVVTFKQTADAQKKAESDRIKAAVKKMSLVARSTKTAKKNIKVTLKTDDETTAAIKEIKSLGYTVKYKYYRSTKKTSKYAAKITKTGKTYTNTNGKNGTRYYYKARVQVYDADGKLVVQTVLKQCKYATRTWSK